MASAVCLSACQSKKTMMHADLEMETVFKDAAEREDSILDVKYFRPVGD
jgi:hypothetical protein